jgi:hypothetical protein
MRARPAALLAALAACSDPAAPLPREGAPAEFAVSFSGFGYGSHDVTLRGTSLVVVRRDFFDPRATDSITVTPSAEAWRTFWTAARVTGVGAWPRECVDTRLVDGAGMHVRFVADGRVLERTMANSWPGRDGRCRGPDVTPDVRAFQAAVGALIGRRYPD